MPLAQQGKELFAQVDVRGLSHHRGRRRPGRSDRTSPTSRSRKTFAGSMMANTPANVAKWIENPDHMKPGALMPNLGMTGEQSKALAAYLLSLK